jgi:SAM-dependent methyltransferase
MKIPWQLKIASKILISYMPGAKKAILAFLPLFKPIPVNDPAYNVTVYISHFSNFVENTDLQKIDEDTGLTVLEMGHGKSMGAGIASHILGADKVYLIDMGELMAPDSSFTKQMTEHILEMIAQNQIKNIEINPDRLLSHINREKTIKRIEHLLHSADPSKMLLDRKIISYLPYGISALKEIDTESVDFIYSQASLEHVFLEEFEQTIKEFYRITKPGGIGSHVIDLRDHLDNSINSLRFSLELWEEPFFRSTGYYTNRLRKSQIIDIFIKAGFRLQDEQSRYWDKVHLPLKKIAPEFRSLSEDDLKCSGLQITIKK